jgi:hypothetical protein
MEALPECSAWVISKGVATGLDNNTTAPGLSHHESIQREADIIVGRRILQCFSFVTEIIPIRLPANAGTAQKLASSKNNHGFD